MTELTKLEIPPKPGGLKLYEIAGDLADLEAIVLQIDDAEHEEAMAILQERVSALQGSLEEKAEAICHVIRNSEAERVACKAEAEHFAKRAKRAESRIEHVKAWLMQWLGHANRPKISAGVFKVSVEANGGRQPIDRARIERALPYSTFSTLSTVKTRWTRIPGVCIEWRPQLVIDEKQLPDEYKLERGQHLRIR